MLATELVRANLTVAARWMYSPRASWPQRRSRTDRVMRFPGAPRGTRVEQVELGGVPCERLAPAGAAPDGGLLYLHGGGFATGSPRGYRGAAARLAAAVGLTAVVPAYRLAPEHPHPAAWDDTAAVYAALAERGGPIAVAGDSAGGGLAIALALALRDAGRPLPAVIGAICPWADLRPDVSGTRPAAPREPVLSRGLLRAFASAYLTASSSADDPLVSPVLADLGGLPPIVVHSCSDDLLAPDAQALAARAAATGARLEHRIWDGLWHDVHMSAWALPGIGDPLGELGASMRAQLS